MTLPELNSADDAEAVIAAVLDDERMHRLREAFSPAGGLAGIVSHAEALLAGFEATAERDQVQRIIARWRNLLDCWDAPGIEADVLDALVAHATAWDLRIGAERDAMPTSVELFPRDTADLIMSIAQDWGMTAAQPPQGEFTVVMPIGGLLRANLSRPQYAADLLARGEITAEMVVALASQRATSRAEQARARALDAPGHSEEAALAFGMERAFGLDPGDWSPTNSAGLVRGPDHDGASVFMGTAPASSSHGRRATTGEAFAWLLTTSLLPDDSSVLQITATHCWLANHVALLTTAPRSMRVRTVGSRMTTEGPARSQIYLQEMKALVDCLPGLRTWAARVPVAFAANVTRLQEVSPMHTLSTLGAPVGSRSRD